MAHYAAILYAQPCHRYTAGAILQPGLSVPGVPAFTSHHVRVETRFTSGLGPIESSDYTGLKRYTAFQAGCRGFESRLPLQPRIIRGLYPLERMPQAGSCPLISVVLRSAISSVILPLHQVNGAFCLKAGCRILACQFARRAPHSPTRSWRRD